MPDGRMRRQLLVACGACLAPVTAGCDESRPSTLTPVPLSETPAEATVAVGPGGGLRFQPGTDRPLRISVDTTVRFVWRSDNHNIVVTDQPRRASWRGSAGPSDQTYDDGHLHEHTFEVPGRYRYECAAHAPAGHGEIRVFDGAVPERPTPMPTPTPQPTVQSGTAAVKVGPGGNLVFEPDEVYVSPDTTVTWVWQSDNHSIQVLSQPDDASWQGSAGPKPRTYDEGHVHEHTFEVPGLYEYHCFPHAPGMAGEVRVLDR